MQIKYNNNIGINGIAHIALNVSDIEISKVFYKKILKLLGLSLVHESKTSCYHIGARTAILIQQVKNKKKAIKFSQNNIGLHHFCFRARSKKDIVKLKKELINLNVRVIRGPINGPWAPGYFYILFEDPDKIRIEVNYVPGKGVLKKNIKFNPSIDY